MTEPFELRVSDEQRDAAAKEIRDHFAAGRLSDEELSDRLGAVYKARTESELRALTTDLPALPATRRAELARRRSQLQRRVLQEAGGGVIAFLVCTAIWAASGANGSFWPIWVALIAIIPLLRTSWRLYGPAPDFDQVERELEQRRQRSGHRGRGRSGRSGRRRF
jgi:Domain of unknown function (DUF1707)